MANNLTRTAESRALDWLTGNTVTAPVLPLQVRLMSANGSDTVAGTEVTGGSYAPEDVAFPSSGSANTVSNSGLVRFDGLPATTVTGIEIRDSNNVRWWYGALAGGSRTVVAGDSIEFPAGDIDLTMS